MIKAITLCALCQDLKKHKKLRREFEDCGLENKFEKAALLVPAVQSFFRV